MRTPRGRLRAHHHEFALEKPDVDPIGKKLFDVSANTAVATAVAKFDAAESLLEEC